MYKFHKTLQTIFFQLLILNIYFRNTVIFPSWKQMKYDRFPQKRTYINMKNEYHNIRIGGQSTCRVLQWLEEVAPCLLFAAGAHHLSSLWTKTSISQVTNITPHSCRRVTPQGRDNRNNYHLLLPPPIHNKWWLVLDSRR